MEKKMQVRLVDIFAVTTLLLSIPYFLLATKWIEVRIYRQTLDPYLNINADIARLTGNLTNYQNYTLQGNNKRSWILATNTSQTLDPYINSNAGIARLTRNLTNYKNNTLQENNTRPPLLPSSKVFKILYWTPASNISRTLGYDWFGMGEGSNAFSQCRYSNCKLTSHTAEYDKSDVVLFHLWLLKKWSVRKFRKYRASAKQKWIMFIAENPDMSMHTASVLKTGYSKFNGMFNATWTYHHKSDIVTNYSTGYFVKKEVVQNSYQNDTDKVITKDINYSAGKSRLVAGFISNCVLGGKRIDYIEKLKKYIDVDIYGKCGKYNCSKLSEESCLEMLEKDYKFYLAFENNLCEDYVTEKLWKIIPRYNIIPIVMGAVNYTNILPPGSFIDIKNFQTVSGLANHLKDLHSNNKKYNSYFKWKASYEFRNHTTVPACELCKFVNENENVYKVYDRLDEFWNPKTDCQTAKVFYNGIMHRSIWR